MPDSHSDLEHDLDLDSLKKLSEQFHAEDHQLHYIIGAGASMAAGLPSWNELNARLIAAYFNEVAVESGGPTAIEYDDEELDALADEFTAYFGRDSVIDILRAEMSRERFYELLHQALYGGQQRLDLQPLHYELAAACCGDPGCGALYTLNYDDVLEQAIEQISGDKATPVTTQASFGERSVVHLHGYLPIKKDESLAREANIILSEKDFFRSRGGNPDQKLRQLLGDERADVLFLGTSMADPRLRRLLFDRLTHENKVERDDKIWVFLTPPEPDDEDDLATRRAIRIAANHVKPFWEDWNVTVVEIANYELIPTALRLIRLGDDLSDWLEYGRNFLEENSNVTAVYEQDSQMRGLLYLLRQHDFLRDRFEVGPEERLTLSFVVPVADEDEDEKTWYLQPVFRFTDPRWEHRVRGPLIKYPADKAPRISNSSPYVRNGDIHLRLLDRSTAEKRRLEMRSFLDTEGATGIAVKTGIIVDARDQDALFTGFNRNKRELWASEQTYSSLLSVPVYDTKRWVPIGAACIASTCATPFWHGLESTEQRDMERLLRSTFRNLLEYESSF